MIPYLPILSKGRGVMLKNVFHQNVLKKQKILKNMFQPYRKNTKIRKNFFKFHSFSVQGTGLHALLSPQIKSIPDII